MKRFLSAALAVAATVVIAVGGPAIGQQVASVPAGGTLSPHNINPQQFYVWNGRIYADRQPVHLHGVNWSGLETVDRAPHGLWAGRPLLDFMKQVRQSGFTAIRFPISPDSLSANLPVADWAKEAGYGPSGLVMLEQTVEAARQAGLWVVLGYNSYSSKISGGDTPAPYSPDGRYRVEDWIADLRRMAQFALQRPWIAGIDLFNEPHGLSWQEWKGLAERGGNAVIRTNPRLLVFVQGVGETRTDTGGYGAFWGSNFTEAAVRPISEQAIPYHKLVLSPHVYGPDVYMMPYFKTRNFARSMPRIWDLHFGHMASRNAMCPGEFGGKYRPGTKDVQWQDAFINYMTQRGGMATCWFYWQFNPNSEDTGGILTEDWQSVDRRKLALLGRLKRIR